MSKLYGSRLSLHTALQMPAAAKYIPANNPDEQRDNKGKKKKPSVAKALNLTQKGSY